MIAQLSQTRSHLRPLCESHPNRPSRPVPTQPITGVALVCGSRWSISESEVTVTYGRRIGFGTGQNR